MKKSFIIINLFLLTSCVSVQIPKSLQSDIVEIKDRLNELKTQSTVTKTQISELNENYQTILKGIVKPSNVVTNYDNLTIEQLDSLRATKGLIKRK